MRYLLDRRGQSILCLILAALLVWMLLPLGNLPQAQLRDPIGNDPLPPMEELQLGEGDQLIPETIPSTIPLESQPRETRPPETEPLTPEETHPDTGDGDEGQEDGLQGDEGGEEETLDLALVMNWYRYGSQKTTIVCGPSETVTKSLNTAQLLIGELKYDFSLTGEQKQGWSVAGVQVKPGDGPWTDAGKSGSISIELPEGGSRAYTFQVLCKSEDAEVIFTFVLNCSHSADLELELRWQEKDGGTDSLSCIPNDTAAKTVAKTARPERLNPSTMTSWRGDSSPMR